MFNAKCTVAGCSDQILFSCSCSLTTFICNRHYSDHSNLPGSRHLIKSLKKRISDELLSQFFRYLNERIVKLNQRLKEFSQISNNIIILVQAEIKKVQKEILEEKESWLRAYIELEKSLFVHKDLLQVFNTQETIYDKDPKFDSIKLIENIQNSIKLKFSEDLKHEIVDKQIMSDDDYGIIFTKFFSNYVIIIDLDTFKTTRLEFETTDLSYLCGACKIDKGKYFLYGGYGKLRSNSVKIIDIVNCKIENLPSASNLSSNCLILFEDEVYSFGGYNEEALNDCEKFSLSRHLWSKIEQLPAPNYITTAALLNNEIFVSGYTSDSLFIYNPLANKFSVHDYKFTKNSCKIMYENWIVCFEDALYGINENQNIVKHNNIIQFCTGINSSAYFKRYIYIYFITSSEILYRINTKIKTLEQLEILN